MSKDRIIGKYSGKKDGPLLLVSSGVHGNEPSGVKALQKIFKELEQSQPDMNGTFVGIKGNCKALSQEKRFVDEDLNRTWKDEKINSKASSAEEKEMQEIIELLEDFQKQKFPKRYFVDCHSTSSDSLPYISVQDVNDNDAFAHNFPVYIVRGFSDIVDGSIDKFFSKQGMTGFTFEGGQHYAETTEANQEAIIWSALKEACQLDTDKVSCYPECVKVLKRNEEGQKTFQIVYRHGLNEKDDFKMQPGFKNFQKIKKGDLLAVHNGKEIKSEWNGRIFMPLYQSQGNDGFFVIEEVA